MLLDGKYVLEPHMRNIGQLENLLEDVAVQTRSELIFDSKRHREFHAERGKASYEADFKGSYERGFAYVPFTVEYTQSRKGTHVRTSFQAINFDISAAKNIPEVESYVSALLKAVKKADKSSRRK